VIGARNSGSITRLRSSSALDNLYRSSSADRDNPILILRHSGNIAFVAETNKRNPAVSIPAGQSLGEFGNYQEASALVERLIAAEFPANQISIIGKDPVLVERVRSRLGYGRVALSGAIAGLWIGILVALLIGAGLETSEDGQISYLPEQFGAVVILAAGISMLFNILRFSFSKTKRGFISTQMPVASRYEVMVPQDKAADATKALSTSASE